MSSRPIPPMPVVTKLQGQENDQPFRMFTDNQEGLEGLKPVKIQLSEADFIAFCEALDKPPEVNAKLKKAAQKYKDSVKKSTIRGK